MLERWKETLPRIQQLVYVLNDNYDDAEKPLKLDRLRNEDMHRALPLKRACDVIGFDLYVSSLAKIVKGDYEEHDEDDWNEEPEYEMRNITNVEYSLERTYSVEGELIALDLPVPESSLLEELDTELDEPDEADYEDGVATHYHRRTVSEECFSREYNIE